MSLPLSDVKFVYEENFTTTGTIETDIEIFKVDLSAVNVTVNAILDGYSLRGGSPLLYIKTGSPLSFDDNVLFQEPTLAEIYAAVLAIATEDKQFVRYLIKE